MTERHIRGVNWYQSVADRCKELKLSRAELCRRAGISDATIFKGIKERRRPTPSLRKQVELILAAEKVMIETGARS
jgi:transcriptional regulator with XRE-family HTH domain